MLCEIPLGAYPILRRRDTPRVHVYTLRGRRDVVSLVTAVTFTSFLLSSSKSLSPCIQRSQTSFTIIFLALRYCPLRARAFSRLRIHRRLRIRGRTCRLANFGPTYACFFFSLVSQLSSLSSISDSRCICKRHVTRPPCSVTRAPTLRRIRINKFDDRLTHRASGQAGSEPRESRSATVVLLSLSVLRLDSGNIVGSHVRACSNIITPA